MQLSSFLVSKGSRDELDGQDTATSSDVGPFHSLRVTLVAPVSLQLHLHGDPKIAQPSHSPSLLPVPFSYLIYQFMELCPWYQALPTWKCNLRSLRIFFQEGIILSGEKIKVFSLERIILIIAANFLHLQALQLNWDIKPLGCLVATAINLISRFLPQFACYPEQKVSGQMTHLIYWACSRQPGSHGRHELLLFHSRKTAVDCLSSPSLAGILWNGIPTILSKQSNESHSIPTKWN